MFKKNFLLQSEKLDENETFTIGKARKLTNKKVNIDNFEITALDNIIHNFHIVHKQLSSLRKLNLVFKTEYPELQFNFAHESLRKIRISYKRIRLRRSMGFKWKKTNDN